MDQYGAVNRCQERCADGCDRALSPVPQPLEGQELEDLLQHGIVTPLLMRFPTSAGDLILDAIGRAALRAARSSASGNGRSPVAKQHHLAITQ